MGKSTLVVPVTRQESEALSPLWGSLSLGSLRSTPGGNVAYGAGCLDLDHGRKFKAGKRLINKGLSGETSTSDIISREFAPKKKNKRENVGSFE